MVASKTIGISAIILLLSGLSIWGGVNVLTDNNAYYCEAKSAVMNCDSLSAYYGLDNGKCLNKAYGNKLCTSGWQKITAEVNLETPIKNIDVVSNEWCCGNKECVVGKC